MTPQALGFIPLRVTPEGQNRPAEYLFYPNGGTPQQVQDAKYFFSAVLTNNSGANAYLQVFDVNDPNVEGATPLMSVLVETTRCGSVEFIQGIPIKNKFLVVGVSSVAATFAAHTGAYITILLTFA